MKINKQNIKFYAFLAVVFLVLWIQPYNEARTFNKFNGTNQPKATIIDAIFARLRVNTNCE